eukprot:10613814-Alexandrium_andersonii.AAC.1
MARAGRSGPGMAGVGRSQRPWIELAAAMHTYPCRGETDMICDGRWMWDAGNVPKPVSTDELRCD